MQALWCWRRQKGDNVEISDLSDQVVTLNKAETASPNAKNSAVYSALQAIQDELSRSLRPAFAMHRRIVG